MAWILSRNRSGTRKGGNNETEYVFHDLIRSRLSDYYISEVSVEGGRRGVQRLCNQ